MDELNGLWRGAHGRSALDSAVPFVLDRHALEIVEALSADAEKIKAAARIGCYFFPAAATWIEHEEEIGRFGMLYQARSPDDPDLTTGSLLTFLRPRDRHILPVSGTVDLSRPHPIHLTPLYLTAHGSLDVPRSITAATSQGELLPQENEKLTGWLLATLALLNSPKIVRFSDVSRSRINAKRMRGGGFPLLDHKVVTIDLGAREVLAQTKDSDGARRALHFVRAHLRIVRGEVLLIKPHWRGDASIGIVKPKYRLTRKP